MRNLIILIFSAAIFLISCEEPALYRKNVTFSSGEWSVQDTAEFRADISDTSKAYDILLNLSHNPDFAYQNLYLKVFTTFPNDSIAEQVLSLQLSTGKGLWAGECGSNQCEIQIPLSDSVRIKQPGPYTFSFVQYSRQDTLPGINGLEFSVAEHNSGS